MTQLAAFIQTSERQLAASAHQLNWVSYRKVHLTQLLDVAKTALALRDHLADDFCSGGESKRCLVDLLRVVDEIDNQSKLIEGSKSRRGPS